MSDWRRRAIYLTCTSAVVLLGLASRRYAEMLPAFVAAYAGDTLWALMVYLGLGSLYPAASIQKRAAAALAFSCVIELSQLYHAPWIDGQRQTTLGGLVLGFGFLCSDLVCYSVGIALGAGVEGLIEWIRHRA